ncbi:GTPase domain-containing protein [Kibdelosporangium philippinense]|uniref:GTPase domain-containing protein n=1 Tax=Kibdelosporangium philippinense TaxID=211113 RepID=A0ABS8ZRM2_9PSEU|nr:GTPase domain-containing protein [Kibdelosporangium philippinense]MCE7010381.1 GTPase domain-containing protein [Kibdelosporangium philippinense]
MEIVALAAVVVAIIWVMRRVKARRPGAGNNKKVVVKPPVPKFRVVTLGLQGSGKTLLLTSIYRRLQAPGNRGYFLKVPYTQLIELNKWYQEVASTDEDWPRGTTRGEMREFDFSVMSLVGTQATAMLDIGYLEYPGELLTDTDAPGSNAQQRLLTAINQAHAVIAIIDGLRILQTYQGDRRGRSILQTTLDAMVHCLLTTPAPVVFVITKWDLLDQLHQDENIRLDLVQRVLMGIEGFRDLVNVHSTRRIVRLVPVSAVGHDFAELRNGVVRKRADGHFEPSNVEVALAAVVPDVLNQVELSLDFTTRQAILAQVHKQTRMSPGEAVRSLAAFLSERAGRVLATSVGGGLLGEAGLALFMDSRAEPDADYQRRIAALSDADRRAEELVQARRRVVQSMQNQVNILEAKLPSSRLQGGA